MHSATYQVANQTQHLQRLQQSSTARPSHAYALTPPQTPTLGRSLHQIREPKQQPDTLRCHASLTVEAPEATASTSGRVKQGHAALLHGLGDVGNVKPGLMPWLLRLAHIRYGALV